MVEFYSSPAMRAATGETVRPGGLDLTRRALDFCAFTPGMRVLDIGCGSGATVRLMSEEYALDASGIDPSSTMISLGVSADPSLSLGLGDGMNLPRGNGELDGAVMECALSITADPERVLREVHRSLKLGAKLILTDMYLLDGTRSLDCSQPVASLLCLRNASSRTALERTLVKAGFRVLLWEDHLPHLKRLGAEIILKFGSLSRFFDEAFAQTQTDASPNGETPTTEPPVRRPPTLPASFRGISYYLIVAEKV